MKKNPFKNLEYVIELEEVCPVHNVHLQQLDRNVIIAGEEEPRKPTPYCPECAKEGIAQKSQNELEKLQNKELYANTYNVLERDSTIPKELKTASFDNFIADTAEEQQLLAFAKQQTDKYLNGMVGNTLITGGTGIGKSHLSISIAKAINEGYKAKNEPKSVLFISLTEIIKEIKEGWNYGRGARLTEAEAVKQLTEVDYLILDDLGAKNATLNPKSDWEQDFLFDILNNRENTIINTNLSGSELRKVYNERNASRIFKGLEGNTFKAFSIKDKRYSIRNLKES
ncbi:ATP-binding protein [Streptococcus gallolyticus]|uniref:ATP-binding protein n=1 Tax=Streptococcus gallolyticus TaxID=315405 RepID=UPI002283E95C|nr:ATP-binding protein [Streptococcus gallolyticus]MCY7179249.1 ATP-binding protein [Streptococcus gallolyticus subsp. gallolyticus]